MGIRKRVCNKLSWYYGIDEKKNKRLWSCLWKSPCPAATIIKADDKLPPHFWCAGGHLEGTLWCCLSIVTFRKKNLGTQLIEYREVELVPVQNLHPHVLVSWRKEGNLQVMEIKSWTPTQSQNPWPTVYHTFKIRWHITCRNGQPCLV